MHSVIDIESVFHLMHTHTHVLAILPPKRGEKVKRVSQIFQSNGEKERGDATMKKTTPTRRLHPVIQSAIEPFPYSKLEHVKTDTKQSLPTKLGKASTNSNNFSESAIFVPSCSYFCCGTTQLILCL